MMKIEEGNGLLGGSALPKANTIDNCVNNPKPGVPMALALALAAGNAADAVEIMCVGFIMSEMSGISTYKKEFLSAAVFMGMLAGGVGCGYLSDVIGRRPCLLYSLGINTIAGLASAAAPNIDILIALRVIAGLGIGGSVPIVFSMGAEIFPADIRGQFLSIIASFWMVGAIYVALTAWVMLGDDFEGHRMMPGLTWRPFALTSALPAILAFLLSYYIIPESPRFLASKGRFVEAAVVLRGLSTVQITTAELETDCLRPLSIDRANRSGYAPVSMDSTSHPSPRHSSDSHHSLTTAVKTKLENSTIVLLFQGRLLNTSLILLVIWFTLSFGSYGMSTWISTLFEDVGIGNPYAAAFIFALANLPGNIVSLVFIEKYGRRWLLSGGMCLAAVSALGFALDTHAAGVVVLCAALFNAFSVIGWNSLDCLSVECFPTHVRTSAMGVLAAGGRLGAVSAQFVNGSLEQNIPLLLFVTSACTVVGGLIAWLLPHDTVGSAMSEHVEDSDIVAKIVSTDGSRRSSQDSVGDGRALESTLSPFSNGDTAL